MILLQLSFVMIMVFYVSLTSSGTNSSLQLSLTLFLGSCKMNEIKLSSSPTQASQVSKNVVNTP